MHYISQIYFDKEVYMLVAWQVPIAVYTVLRLVMMDSSSVRNM